MAAITWSPTVASLDAALFTANGADVVVAQALRDRIANLGAVYDLVFTPAVDAEKVAGDARYTAALSAWQARVAAAQIDVDRTAAYLATLHTPPQTAEEIAAAQQVLVQYQAVLNAMTAAQPTAAARGGAGLYDKRVVATDPKTNAEVTVQGLENALNEAMDEANQLLAALAFV